MKKYKTTYAPVKFSDPEGNLNFPDPVSPEGNWKLIKVIHSEGNLIWTWKLNNSMINWKIPPIYPFT